MSGAASVNSVPGNILQTDFADFRPSEAVLMTMDHAISER